MSTKTRKLTRPTPSRDLDVLDDVDRMFEGLFSTGWLRPFRELLPHPEPIGETVAPQTPRVEMIDQDAELVVQAELPGIRREDLHLDLTAGLLTISGEKRRAEQTQSGNLLHSEITYGAFSRTLRLPAGVDAAQAKADFRDGVLKVHLPKRQETERHAIEIS